MATAIIFQVLLEWIDARTSDRALRFAGSWADLLNFLPPAIIPGLAVTMLLYPNDRLMPVIFGVGLAICSKVIFRAPVADGKTQHIFNPSNLFSSIELKARPFQDMATFGIDHVHDGDHAHRHQHSVRKH